MREDLQVYPKQDHYYPRRADKLVFKCENTVIRMT